MTTLYRMAVLSLVLALSGCSGSRPLPTEMPYVVIKSQDLGFAGMRYAILSEQATTLEERAHTTRRAALDLQKSSKANSVLVLLQPDIAVAGYPLAIAQIEGGSLTRLEAAPTQYTAQDVLVIAMVDRLQKQFAEDRTEERRYAAVAEALHITPGAVRESVKVFLTIESERKPSAMPQVSQ